MTITKKKVEKILLASGKEEKNRFCQRRIDTVKNFYKELETERILNDAVKNPKKYLNEVKKEMELKELDSLKEKAE